MEDDPDLLQLFQAETREYRCEVHWRELSQSLPKYVLELIKVVLLI